MKAVALNDPETKSFDTLAANIDQLRALLPEAWIDGGVDFDVLRQLLGALVDEGDEKYGLNWHGKRRARQLALTPSTGTLRPCPGDSVNWDTTQNLLIEGDNLEALKLLQKSYAGKVKLIYIDPPYNTGKDFVYPDSFQDNIKNYLELTGQTGEGGKKLSSNTEASGRFHTDWLNMLYPRLKLARTLLREDGVMFVSIDDHEEAALRFILDEIMGEENRVSTMVWDLGTGATAGHFTRSHELVLCYARNKGALSNFAWRKGGVIRASALKKISRLNPASEIRFPAGIEIEGGGDREFKGTLGNQIAQTIVSGTMRFKDGKLLEPVTLSAGWAMRTQINSWIAGQDTIDTKGQRVRRFFFSASGLLQYEKERTIVNPKSVLRDIANTADGSVDLVSLGFAREVFDFPKPVRLIRFFVDLVTDPLAGDIVLDFFAGSGSTAHAVLDLNTEDEGNRRFILVQLPEPTGRADYSTIAAMCAERIRRVIARLDSKGAGTIDPDRIESDRGFRFFKLDSSNIRAWEPDYDKLEKTLEDAVEHVKVERTEQDILCELLLKLGLDLAVPIEQRTLAGNRVTCIGGGALIVCLSKQIAASDIEPLARGIAEWQQQLAPAGGTSVVFLDSAFPGDVAKTNLSAILHQHGIDSVRSI